MADYDENDDGNGNESWSTSEIGISFYFFVFLSLLALSLVLGNLLNSRPKLGSVLPEAGMTILVGAVAGLFVHVAFRSGSVPDGLLSFSSEVLFVALLPPIIFISGYHIKPVLFFRHIKPIVLLSCLGTVIQSIAVALILYVVSIHGLTGNLKPSFSELLTFGALISATDTVSILAIFQKKRVDPHLFYLVFGESALNDAVALVLFRTFSNFVENNHNIFNVAVDLIALVLDFTYTFAGSFVLGILCGVGVGVLLKKVNMKKTALYELCLYVLVMYLPYFLATILHLSGIVTILFTGISAKRYAAQNLSRSTEIKADSLFRATAHLAETAIFLELGLSLFNHATFGNFYWEFILWALLACLGARALAVYPIVFGYNKSLKLSKEDTVITRKGSRDSHFSERPISGCEKSIASPSSDDTSEHTLFTPNRSKDKVINWGKTHMMWFSGLRGAVAYACAHNFPESSENGSAFMVTTSIIILVTVFLFGGTADFMLELLGIPTNVDEEKYMQEKYDDREPGKLERFEKAFILPYVTDISNIECDLPVDEVDHFALPRDDSVRLDLSAMNNRLSDRHFIETHEPTGWKSIYDYGYQA
mmetsp:Transcript_1857/g.3324  ORF Transcript_1857/g.3324 Transcript_1857/m.3324 type:complete len:592 (-) Transcript_1857:2356-4131(-)